MTDADHSPRSAREPPQLREARILVVDDTERIHEDFRRILEGSRTPALPERIGHLEHALFGDEPAPAALPAALPFTVDSAHQGEQGLERVEQSLAAGTPYSVAFVDIRMPPGWDGIETTQRLWRADPHLQIVLCTTYSDYSWRAIVGRLGSTDQLLLLKKPFDSAEVMQLATALTARWSLQREHARLVDGLEAQVEQRTHELAASHDRLRREMHERLEAERRARHLQRVQTLGRLSASIGHEINNPLCFITGNLEMLALDLDRLRGRPSDAEAWAEARHILDDALEGAQRIAKIVSAMRGLAHGGDDPSSGADVARAIDTATRLTLNELRHRARLVVDRQPAPPLRIGQRELEQILVNLLVNAGHAIPTGQAEAHEIRVSATTDERGRVDIVVSDTGRGIDPEDLPHVLEPFYTTKPPDQGTGLGLSLCRDMLEAAGGTLELTSQPGHGTTARVGIPFADPPPPPAPPPPAVARPSAPTRPIKILLVDDEPPVLRMLQRALGAYDVQVARSGHEALARCRENSFDLVICDVVMPDLTGVEVCRRLRRERPLRVLFITGGVPDASLESMLEQPQTSCIRKPFSLEQIRRAVEHQLAELA